MNPEHVPWHEALLFALLVVFILQTLIRLLDLLFSKKKETTVECEEDEDEEPPTPSFPWVRFTLLFAVIIAAGMLAQQYFKAPINRTLELTTYSSEVPSATTATLQLHQDGTVTWQRPPSMNDRIWALPSALS